MNFVRDYFNVREFTSAVNGFAAGFTTNIAVSNLLRPHLEDYIDNPIVGIGSKAISAAAGTAVGCFVHQQTEVAFDNALTAVDKTLKTVNVLRTKNKVTNEQLHNKISEIWTGYKAD